MRLPGCRGRCAGAAIVGRRTGRAQRRADVPAGERAGAVGEAVAAATLFGERAGIAVAHTAASRTGRSASVRSRPGCSSRPAQQSIAFLQTSPTARQWGVIIGAGMSAQRPTPGGPSLQVPEQHSAIGVQGAPLLIGSATRRPGAAFHAVGRHLAAARAAVHVHLADLERRVAAGERLAGPAAAGTGACTGRCSSRWARCRSRRRRGSSRAARRPAGRPRWVARRRCRSSRCRSRRPRRRGGSRAWPAPRTCRPCSCRCSSRWRRRRGCPWAAQAGPPQAPFVQSRPQQLPARAHGCPLEEQPAAARQTGAGAASGGSRAAQEASSSRRPGRRCSLPAGRPARRRLPAAQLPEQQAPSAAQAAPFAAQAAERSGRGVVSSTSFRQPSDQQREPRRASAHRPAERIAAARTWRTRQAARRRGANPARELAEVAAGERARAPEMSRRLRGLHRADERLLAQRAARRGVERALVVGARARAVPPPPLDLRGGVEGVLAHRRRRAPPVERVVGGRSRRRAAPPG